MAALEPTPYLWHNGKLIPWADATLHVGAHALHYGSSVFEGIRCYNTERGPAVFRLPEHARRLVDSARIYRMELDYDAQQLAEACLETIRANEMEHCYIRPIALRGYHSLGVNPLPCPIETYIMVWEWGAYLGEEALEAGADLKVASWNRMAPNTLPFMAKAGANYMNSQLVKMEAVTEGFAEAIALTPEGLVSEGSGENIFVVRDEVIHTPSTASSILPGITRDCVITLARDLGFEVRETDVPREMLYIADEVFMSGTAAEITPVRSIDRIQIGLGRRGAVTEQIQRHFFDIVQGRTDDLYGWLTPVYPEASDQRTAAMAGESSVA
ncbi:MAG TPA: branched-chain amino acid transaminase [Acidobacteriota bacterium]|nr:branched-chain amino acid transaminase [Acidobacteriota bacterium]